MPSDFLDIEKDIYRDRHAAELERRGQVNDRADSQVSLLTIFVAIVGYYILGFPHASWSWGFVGFIGAFTILCSGTVVAGVYVGRLIWCDVAEYPPNPAAQHEWCMRDLNFRRGEQQDENLGRQMAEQDANEELHQHIFRAANANALRNDRRDHLIFLSKRWIFVALIGFIFTAIVNLRLTAVSAAIKLTSSGANMANDTKPTTTPQGQNPPSSPQPNPQSAKPAPLPNKRINANDETRSRSTYLNERKR